MADVTTGYVPGTPEWWLSRLLYRLMYRQNRYDWLEAYVEGNHPLPDVDERYIRAYKSLQRKARTNYIGMITTTPVERMKVKNFVVDGEVSEDLSRWWNENNGEFQSPVIHMTCGSLGNSFIKVVESPPSLFSSGMPKYQALDPRTTITEEDPMDPLVTKVALEMWSDPADGATYALLHMQDWTYYFTGPNIHECYNLDMPGLTQRLLNFQGGGLKLVSRKPTPHGVVPIVRLDWIPSFKGISKAEAEDVIDVQDRINSTILDRMVIARNQAYRQRWAKGIRIPQGKDGQKKAPFDPGADKLWAVTDPAAEFGEFSEADIRQILEAIRDDVADMAAITKTPAHYLMGKMANVSGSTLDQAEAGMISKTRQRMTAVGTGWVRVAKLTFIYMGRPDLAKSNIEVCWYDPAYHSVAESADALNKHVAAGIPLTVAANKFGNYSALELKQIAQYQEEQQVLDQQRQQQEMAMKQQALNTKQATPTPGG